MLHACWPELGFSMLKADVSLEGSTRLRNRSRMRGKSMFSPRVPASVVK
jgi:hypothetical protein